MGSGDISEERKQLLTEQYQTLNPFELKKNLEDKLKLIFDKIDLQYKGKRKAI